MMITPWMNFTMEMARLGMATQSRLMSIAMGSPAMQQTREAAQMASRTAQEAAGVMIGSGMTPAQADMMRRALRTYRRHQHRQRQHQTGATTTQH
ncbi:MAG: hypothetical protein NWR47_08525 [Aestuariivirgaceae bacterium]|nr:hypothetical protein [Aestuariivirgaceae bacterium]